jgi:lipoprotein-anchoring transpeptidase ErfK/SrfK
VLPPGEEIVFDGTLYVPPFGTANRRIPGELGRYKLDLGDGYLIHGTPDQSSVGTAATHGCLRLREADLRFVYERVPTGTAVYIY